MKDKVARKILSQTRHGYDMVSKKFSQTRKYFWRGLEFIADYSKDGSMVFDYGCGNGRLLEILKDKNIKYYGVDVSKQLIDSANEKYGSEKVTFKSISSSQDRLAFPEANFNSVYSIAVFHHFPGDEYREFMARVLFRVTKPGGYIVVTVWNLWQKKYLKNIFYQKGV